MVYLIAFCLFVILTVLAIFGIYEYYERKYDEQTNQWYSMFGMLPCYEDFIWQTYHKRIPSKKAIIRQLNKWNLPKGTKLRFIGSYDWKIFKHFEVTIK